MNGKLDQTTPPPYPSFGNATGFCNRLHHKGDLLAQAVLSKVRGGWVTTLALSGLAGLGWLGTLTADAAELGLADLRCEYLQNPVGIDVLQPRLSWKLESLEQARGVKQTSYRMLVADSPEVLAKDEGDLWDSGKVETHQSTQVVYAGKPLASRTICYWKVKVWYALDGAEGAAAGKESAWSQPAQWSMGMLKPEDWSAKWTSMKPSQWEPAEDLGLGKAGSGLNSRNSPMLRKVFTLAKPVRDAQVSICGLGYYEMFLNGGKVGDHVLDPAWTCYHKNALYVTYDISKDLKPGANALGVQLANGIYNQEFGDPWGFKAAQWRAFPQMLLQLDVTFTDGTKQRLVSDETWKASDGPIYWDQLRMGVMYDARREHPGWSQAGFDDTAWQPAILREGVKGKLAAQVCEPIKVMKTLKALSVVKGDGFYEVDFGQNIAGWTRIKVTGEAGTRITMDYGAHGANIEGKPLQTEVYTLKGGGEEVWEPDFTYNGFSKVKVSGFPGTPNKENFEARVVHTAFEERGAFACSNPLLNQIGEMCRWSYIGNFVGIPTDCPHREKNAWCGDAQATAELGLTYYGSEAAYTRWILDFQAIQREDGKLPCMVPGSDWGFDHCDGPAWEISYIAIPWHLYEYRGDQRILGIHYQNYKRWLQWYRKHPSINKGQIINYGLGDWCSNQTQTPPEITSTGYYYAAAKRIAAIAGMLGKTDEQQEYGALAEEIKQAFNKAFYHPETGLYWAGSQTAMSCALYHGLVDPGNHDRVVKNLVDSIRKNNYALDFGLLGSKYVLRVLCDNGYADVAYSMVIKDETQGWVKMLRTGNTTLWENFLGLGSNNHVFLGDVGAWFINYLAGIRPDLASPGFQRFWIRPEIPGELTWVKAHHDSPYGRIKSEWKKAGNAFSLNVTIPANSTAEVYIPASKADEVREGGNLLRPPGYEGPASATKVTGVKFLRMESGRAVYLVGSGEYCFASTLMN
jgi:alpha-L-rhamnosidase